MSQSSFWSLEQDLREEDFAIQCSDRTKETEHSL